VTLRRDRSELESFARRAENYRLVERDTLTQLEPDLGERFDRALFMEQEAHLDPRDTLRNLRARLSEQGVTFATIGDATGQVIDCRGLTARDQLRALRGVKGEMVVLRAPDIDIARPVRLLHPRFPLYIVPRGDGVFVLGATQIESDDRTRATVRSVLELLSAAYALHPGFGEAEILEIGTDARPAFPDNLPRIGRNGQNIYVNGLFRHGFLLAPALACMVGDLLLDGKTPEVWHEDCC
jgi:glycine oxidase